MYSKMLWNIPTAKKIVFAYLDYLRNPRKDSSDNSSEDLNDNTAKKDTIAKLTPMMFSLKAVRFSENKVIEEEKEEKYDTGCVDKEPAYQLVLYTSNHSIVSSITDKINRLNNNNKRKKSISSINKKNCTLPTLKINVTGMNYMLLKLISWNYDNKLYRSTNKTTNSGLPNLIDRKISGMLFPSAQNGSGRRKPPITLPFYAEKGPRSQVQLLKRYNYNPSIKHYEWTFPVHQKMATNIKNNQQELLPQKALIYLTGNSYSAEQAMNMNNVNELVTRTYSTPTKRQPYTIICVDYPGAHSGTKRYGKRVNLDSVNIDETLTSFTKTLVHWACSYGTKLVTNDKPQQKQPKPQDNTDIYAVSIGGYVIINHMLKESLLGNKLPFKNVWLEKTMSSLSDFASTKGYHYSYDITHPFSTVKDIDLSDFIKTIENNTHTQFHVIDANNDEIMQQGARLGEQMKKHSDNLPENLRILTAYSTTHSPPLNHSLCDFFQYDDNTELNVAIDPQSELDAYSNQQENQLFLTQLLHKASQKVHNRYQSFGRAGTKIPVYNVNFVVPESLATAVNKILKLEITSHRPTKYKQSLLDELKKCGPANPKKCYTTRDPWTCTLYKGPQRYETTDDFFRRILSTPRLPKHAGPYINDLFSTSNIQPGISRSTYFKIMADKEACALFKLAELHKSPYPYAYTRAILALFKIGKPFFYQIWENIKSKQKKYNTSNDYVPDLYNPQPPPLHNLPRNLLHNGWLQRAIIAAGEYIVKSRNHSFTCHRSENTTRKFIGELLSYAKDKYSKEKRIVFYGEEYCSLNDIISREVKALVEGQRPYEEKLFRFFGTKMKSGHGEGSRRAIFNHYFPDLGLLDLK